jgi:hypothetical protein
MVGFGRDDRDFPVTAFADMPCRGDARNPVPDDNQMRHVRLSRMVFYETDIDYSLNFQQSRSAQSKNYDVSDLPEQQLAFLLQNVYETNIIDWEKFCV